MTVQTWIVILNWRNAPDTCECLTSILGCTSRDEISGVVVCDNDSGDGSMDMFRQWGDTTGCDVSEYERVVEGFRIRGNEIEDAPRGSRLPIVLIQNCANLGFAGGNNIGIEFLLRHRSFDYVLLLNNDALIRPGAISAMLGRFKERDDLGMCGCTVIYHHTPTHIQALGGATYEPWLGRSRHIGAHSSVAAVRVIEAVEQELDYILGAALMISRRCLQDIGLMDDSYFLYYEELDWAVRAKKAGYALGYAPTAEVLHKEGRTIGSSASSSKRSLLSEYYLMRSRQIFTRKFFPMYLPTVIVYSLLQTIRPLIRLDLERGNTRIRGLIGGLLAEV